MFVCLSVVCLFVVLGGFVMKYIFTVSGITIRREREEGKRDRPTDRQTETQTENERTRWKTRWNSQELRRLNRKNTTS